MLRLKYIIKSVYEKWKSIANYNSTSITYSPSVSSANIHVAVKKVDVTGSINWMASYAFWPVIKSLAIDAAEQSVYFADYEGTNLIVLKLSTTDGAVVSQHKL